MRESCRSFLLINCSLRNILKVETRAPEFRKFPVAVPFPVGEWRAEGLEMPVAQNQRVGAPGFAAPEVTDSQVHGAFIAHNLYVVRFSV